MEIYKMLDSEEMNKKIKRKKKREIESDKIFDEDSYMKNYGNYFKHNCNIKLSKKGKY